MITWPHPVRVPDNFDAARHEYRVRGRAVPSVSQCMACVRPAFGCPPDVLEKARARGTAIHRLTELHDLGMPLAAVGDEYRPYLLAWQDWLRHSGAEAVLIEQQVATDTYAGTFDRLVHLPHARPGRPEWLLVDIKTSATVSPVDALQTALYAHALVAHLPPSERPRVARATVQLRADGTYRQHDWNSIDDLPVALACVTATNWRLTHANPT